MVVRWPGKIKPGQISNEIVQHHDWFPTFLAMAGDPDVVEKLKSGYQAIGRTYKNHIDGYNLVPYLTGEAKESPRKFFMYLSDDGDVLGLRYDNWKMVFMEQRCHGTLQVWAEPFTRLRMPKIFNLRTDPYERADQTSNTYYDWYHSSRLPVVRSAGGRRPMGGDLQGLPAGSEAQHLHPRRRVEDDARNRRRNALSPHSASGGRLLACRLWRSTLSGQGRALRPEIRGGPR